MQFLDKEGNIIDEIDLGIVDVGTSKTYEFKLFNDNGTFVDKINIWFDVQTDELEILEQPRELKNNEMGIVKIRFTPNLKIKAGLKTKIFVKVREIWD